MNPILLYPKDAENAKFLREAAEYTGANVVKLPEEILEKMDDFLYGQYGDAANIKHMEGYADYYRIRFGDYRIGLFLVDESTVRLLAIGHRGVFYRYFPGNYA